MMNGVVGGSITGGRNIAGGDAIVTMITTTTRLVRLFVLRQIVHRNTLPHRIHRDSYTEQHELAAGRRISIASAAVVGCGSIGGAGTAVMAVVPALRATA